MGHNFRRHTFNKAALLLRAVLLLLPRARTSLIEVNNSMDRLSFELNNIATLNDYPVVRSNGERNAHGYRRFDVHTEAPMCRFVCLDFESTLLPSRRARAGDWLTFNQ